MFSVRFHPVAARHVGSGGWKRVWIAPFSSMGGRGRGRGIAPASIHHRHHAFAPPAAVTSPPTRYRSFTTPTTSTSESDPQAQNSDSKGNREPGLKTIFLVAFVGGTLGCTLGDAIGRRLVAPAPSTTPSASLSSQTALDTDEDTDTGVYASPEETREAIAELRAIFAAAPPSSSSSSSSTPDNLNHAGEDADASTESGKVSTDPDDLHNHGFSANDHYPEIPPSVVVYPTSTEDVVKIVYVARKYRVPVIPYSGATALEGQYRAHSTGGICVDMSNMDKILEIHEQDADIVCQPGARWMDINETLKERGIPLFFPIDPAPSATIGGMLSTGCSGTNAVRYGTAKGEWFLNVTVVLPSGEVIKTRRRSRKSSAGFDVTKLFVGAEGTLGIVTEVTIRLAPLLPTTVAVVQFPDVQKATEAVIEVMNTGVGIQCVELVDTVFISAINKQYGVSARKYAEKDSLFFKFQGPTPAALAETAVIVERITTSERYGGTSFALAKTTKEAEELWSDRKNAHYSGLALAGEGGRGWPTDVCVPVSNLPELVYETKKDITAHGLVSTIVGHVGDGNFHALILFHSDEEKEVARQLVHRMVKRAIALDGTCTGEHGVGIGKREYLVEELGEGTVNLMKTIKRAIDPMGLFNPGKLYPEMRRPPGAVDAGQASSSSS